MKNSTTLEKTPPRGGQNPKKKKEEEIWFQTQYDLFSTYSRDEREAKA